MYFRYKTLRHFIRLWKTAKLFCTSSHDNFKVTVLGAAGGIGQPLALLLKQNPLVSHVAAYDVNKITPGVAVDLSHINTRANIEGFSSPDQLGSALCGATVAVYTAGLARKPGMSRDDLFKTNANIIFDLTCAVARYAPCAIIAIVTNPVNSVVPIASEVMMRSGLYDPCKIFGITTLDLVRASTFVSQLNCSDPACQYVPVIGGHAGETIIPLLSQSVPPVFLQDTTRDQLTKRIQDAGTEVVKAKASGGSATLSTAFSAARFTDSILRGLAGEQNVIECAYVRSGVTEATYFATPVVLGRCGMESNLGIGPVSPYESNLIKKAIPMLQKNILTGEKYVEEKCKTK